MHIFLIGYMGSGKTITGNRLARHMQLDFIDLDFLFEEKYKISVCQFFNKYGEALFRKLENKLLMEYVQTANMVMSVGGGTPFYYDNMQLMNEHGITVYLKMTPEALYQRLTSSKRQRPLLDNLQGEELKAHIRDQLSQREQYYNQAKIIVSGLDVDLEGLVELIRGGTSLGLQ